MTDHAHELRRYARKIAHPAGDVPGVMLAAAEEIERLAARLEAAEKSDAESIAMYRKARDERDALRAKIAEMEKQEIDQKAELYAIRFGRDDIGGLSFCQGPHAEIKMDHYTSMIELADEVRATLAAAPKPEGE